MDHESALQAAKRRPKARPNRQHRGANGQGPLASTLAAIEALRDAALGLERECADDIARCAPAAREGACNLLHYLALRRHDLRGLQRELGNLGLSSLGRMEGHVMATLDAVTRALRALGGDKPETIDADPRFDLGDALLAEHARRVFGPEPAGRSTRIMVTLPTEAAEDPSLLPDLLQAGADLVRINAAHDDPATWTRMIGQLDAARALTGRACRVSFDLAGPKLRVGPLEPGHAVLKLRPRRDALGRELAPATVLLIAAGRDALYGEDTLPVDPKLLRRVQLDDTFEFIDARGRKRTLRVTDFAPAGEPVCECDRTAYLVSGTVLTHRRGKKRAIVDGEVGALPARPGEIMLRTGDSLEFVLRDGPGRERRIALDGTVLCPAMVSCEVAEVFACLQPGQRVLFDDGRIGTVVREAAAERALLEVVRCPDGGARLRAEKGINLPDTVLALRALTEHDREPLAFAARHADIVSASFVQQPDDVERLLELLAEQGAHDVALALKIETATGFSNLPELLLAAMRHPGGVAVMVARGDLAVEVGFERLAEVQEEILWLCEAAHVPVIWATQVLDGLARDGMPSRAEVSDAAMSGRAECVMLNKGPFIVEAVGFLADVLERMRAHQEKKNALLRALSISRPAFARRRAPSGD